MFIDADQIRHNTKGELEEPLPDFKRLKADVGYNDYNHTEFEDPGEPGTVFDNEAYEARLELWHHSLVGWSGAVRLLYRNQDFAAIGEEAFVAPTETQSSGAFIVEERQFGPVTVELGGGYERRDAGASSGNPDVDHDLYSLSADVIYKFAKNYALNVSATGSQRAPAAQELYTDGLHLATLTFEQGDSSLHGETAYSVDIGLRRTEGRLTWSLNAFANRIDDFIYQQGVDS